MKAKGSLPARNHNFIGADGLIHNIYVGNQNGASLFEVEKELTELASELRHQGLKVLVFTDVLKIGKINLSARLAGVQIMKSIDFDKVAIYGPSHLEKTVVNVICQASGKSFKARYFTDERRALDWLREEYV